MRYQEKFLTIWDTPTQPAAQRKAEKKRASNGASAPQTSALKEAFLTIWDSTKRRTAR